VNKRRLAIGIGLAILVGVWLLWNGEEAPPPKEKGQQAEIPASPRTPPWSPPAQVQPPPPAYGPGYPGLAGPYGQPPRAVYPPPEESYQFRPLGERERRRIEEQARGPYGPAYPYPSQQDAWPSQRQPGSGPPPTYGIDPSTRDPWMRDGGGRGWGTEAYGSRPPEPGRSGVDRWQGPYSNPVRPGDWPPPDPGLFNEPNQWGAVPPERTPPSYRMYPSLDAHRDRRMAAR
jgi:hypothetical protein